jgi:hypothetical protein
MIRIAGSIVSINHENAGKSLENVDSPIRATSSSRAPRSNTIAWVPLSKSSTMKKKEATSRTSI